MLRLGLKQRENPPPGYMVSRPRVDAFYADVLATYYGWPVSRSFVGGQRFSMREIGERRYRAGMSALSRAASRLEDRGLIICYIGVHSRWTGYALTETGLAEARRLAEAVEASAA
jgi:hypothetical protein